MDRVTRYRLELRAKHDTMLQISCPISIQESTSSTYRSTPPFLVECLPSILSFCRQPCRRPYSRTKSIRWERRLVPARRRRDASVVSSPTLSPRSAKPAGIALFTWPLNSVPFVRFGSARAAHPPTHPTPSGLSFIADSEIPPSLSVLLNALCIVPFSLCGCGRAEREPWDQSAMRPRDFETGPTSTPPQRPTRQPRR